MKLTGYHTHFYRNTKLSWNHLLPFCLSAHCKHVAGKTLPSVFPSVYKVPKNSQTVLTELHYVIAYFLPSSKHLSEDKVLVQRHRQCGRIPKTNGALEGSKFLSSNSSIFSTSQENRRKKKWDTIGNYHQKEYGISKLNYVCWVKYHINLVPSTF